MVNELLSTWGPRAKFVDDLTALEIVPRNFPSVLCHIVADIQSFAGTINMELNPSKCKDMIVDFLHFDANVFKSIVIGATCVETVSCLKLLGVYITSDLTWSVHCDHIIKKSNRRFHALRKLKKRVASHDVLLVYCTIIRPILEYASVVFANLPQSLSKDLEKFQRRALSIIHPNCSYEDALKEAGIDSLELRRNVACKRFFESVLRGNPLYSFIPNCPVPQTHGYDLRADNATMKIKTRTDRFGNLVTVKYAF